MRSFIILVFFLFFSSTVYGQRGPIPPIESGFGADGQFSVKVETFRSPKWRDEVVTVFLPAELNRPAPAIFFSHGYGATDPSAYLAFLKHIASRGYVVVYSPYRTVGDSFPEKYETMFAGFKKAVKKYRRFIDTSKIGFVGHSFGGGAVPALARRALIEEGWGSAGSFMFMLAPFYSYNISQDQLLNFPSNTKLVVQVYDEDTINDHRMGKDIFETISIPNTEKDYIVLYSDRSTVFNYNLLADHGVPSTIQVEGRTNVKDSMDYYGVWRIFDALAEYTFTDSRVAKNIALGDGNREQRFMGRWPEPDGRNVKELDATDLPVVTKPESFYRFQFSNPMNPRRDFQ
ncbi:MAG: alpha/beta hydrolase fold domain-containing protein [Blastocatellia bacterium]|nr:alpha/beta hydrolase fold domain-containing protein [Blastocatellia bacterium]